MKKVLCALCAVFLLTGCGEKVVDEIMNTPTKKVENLFSKYQRLDEDVLDDLDTIVAEEESFNTEQRERYRTLMKKHYENLSYKVKDEVIDGDNAIVTVEIEVTDYTKINNIDNLSSNGIIEASIDELLDDIESAKDKVTYTLEIPVTKYDDEWTVDPLSEENFQKIHGIYNM